mmetsp:Transcript_90163/g.254289  ORF Transcript_90163/g.254289 Transcript_90163/m.254289 type:complete len:258 (-) Transcript_90163:420-1193(-)|eukprot:CAMPEP_0117595394 /NCGR_PEP_ID=MMETSP0784-20121206/73737_1 /TAXON_ID=39447 /ORGANISM="" /LENGTH=257 /DNA_ID=CAMNT_0005397569 /DNA_START=221 /DNA_END=994 /DNA_ORIENTATION=-
MPHEPTVAELSAWHVASDGRPAWLSQDLVDKYSGCRTGSTDSTSSSDTSTSACTPHLSLSSGESVASDGCSPDSRDSFAIGSPVWLGWDSSRSLAIECDTDFHGSLGAAADSYSFSAPSTRGVVATRGKQQRATKYQDIWRTPGMAATMGFATVDVAAEGARISEEHASPPCVSEGSRLHAVGRCKPCAFFHESGCHSGADCKFCHLCPPREVQRRKRVRRRIAREQLARVEEAWGFSSPSHTSPVILPPWAQNAVW